MLKYIDSKDVLNALFRESDVDFIFVPSGSHKLTILIKTLLYLRIISTIIINIMMYILFRMRLFLRIYASHLIGMISV